MFPVRKDYRVVSDNSFDLLIELETKVNIEKIYFTIKDNMNKVVLQKTLQNGITFENNNIYIKVKPEDTRHLKNTYNYDVKIKYNKNLDKLTILFGEFKVKKLTTLSEDEV